MSDALLSPARRPAGNHRLADVDRIHLVQRLEVHGVPLEEIAAALTTRQADVAVNLDRIDADLRALRSAAEGASPGAHGLLAAIAARVRSLITVALQIPPSRLPP